MCLLFETIRIVEGVPQNLPLHEERMNRSRKTLFGSNNFLKLADYIDVSNNPGGKTERCRVVYGSSVISVEFSPYTPAGIKTLRIVEADTLVYDHKYSDRSQLAGLIDKGTADDILIVRNKFVTDASFANIVLTDGSQWITPDTPLLRGTMRESLLRNGTISEGRITVDNLMNYSHFRLINAMLGFESPILPICNLIVGGSLH